MAAEHRQHPTAVLAEAFATFILAIVVYAAVDTRNSFAPNLALTALWIGFIIAFIIMVGAPLTMACINPARDLGPRIAIAILGWGAAAFQGVGRPWWVWTVARSSAPWPVAPPGRSSSAGS